MLEENGGRRRSIHQPMRDAIESIKLLYELYAMESHDVRAKDAKRKNASSQTSPWLRPAGSRKRRGENERELEPAKTRRVGSGKSVKTDDVQMDLTTEKETQVITTGAEREQINREKGKEQGTWTKVKSKKGKLGQTRNIRARPDALIISAETSVSYADILRKIKDDGALKPFGESVKTIRRTAKN